MNRTAVFLLALACAAPVVAADFYRWVDEKGGVHYSDLPPPPSIKSMKRIGMSGSDTGEPAKARPPVVLYSSNCGATCDQAADYLRQRGVPFTLKNVDKDKLQAAELKKRTGAFEVPVLFVGESMQRGYSPSVWDKMLEVAGYAAPTVKEDQTGTAAAPPQDQP
ncbi:MAG: glutaredoxin family protein [Gallionellaceae bacterium]|nr:glutaredoxin family protein [Gallionellaceae bacterium]